MSYVVHFTDEKARFAEQAGGKGANLGLLTAAGFDVPPGLAITAGAYSAFIERTGIGATISSIVGNLAYGDAVKLDAQTGEIRQAIEREAMPHDLAAEIAGAYASLGENPRVAVRSSGTAEDMAGASFAGLHDTILDVFGSAAVLDAIKRCWASMWSARAVAYRHNKGFSHDTIGMAVVVQQMIPAEVSGVMFTANPLDARTDEIVVNASWGLGEAIVSGIVTPDEYVLSLDDLRIKKKTLGSKEAKIVRAPDGAVGTVRQQVPPEDRSRFCLGDDAIATLGMLGRRIMEHYDGLPQDIEWALAGGKFYVLQSRPVTGVDFLWEECLEDAAQEWPDDDNTIWTQKWAEMYWTGGISPLFYSVRGRHYRKGIEYMMELAGLPELKKKRYYKYHRGTIYYNADFHKTFAESIPQFARAAILDLLPDSWAKETAARPVDVIKCLRMLLSVNSSYRSGLINWQTSCREFIETRIDQANGLSKKELRRLTDDALRRYAYSLEQMQREFSDAIWIGVNLSVPHIFGLFRALIGKWYKGDNKQIFQDLVSGLPVRSLQSREMHELFQLSQQIRQSDYLSKVFKAHEGASFFAQLADTDEGRTFLKDYNAFVAFHGHRGHADRDAYYIRRAEDPGLDYEAFRSLLSNPSPVAPWEAEARVVKKREEATAELFQYLREQPFGNWLVYAAQFLHQQVLGALLMRDDWRHFADRITFSKRKAFLEVGRRCVERGRIADADDAFFLSDIELYGILNGSGSVPLANAKIKSRRKAFDAVNARQASLPLYLRGRKPVDLDGKQDTSNGVVTGIGMSGGIATGRARIVPDLRQIGRVEKGDILICNATDPGWAPVFTLINGLVIETGGMLAHGACLSREHGIPALQIRNAMQLIQDGASVEIRGETGELMLL